MKKFALIGKKLSHSLSPILHTKIMKENNILGDYTLIELEKVDENTLKELDAFGLTGFNITIPYKQDLIKYLDYISEKAKNIGAINTVLIKDHKFYGYNTDYFGVIKMLHDIDIKNKICYVLGTGGGAHAVIQALFDLGAQEIYVVTRDKNKIDIKNRFPYIKLISYDEMCSGDIIINATPVGMYPNIESSPVSEEIISKFKVAIDIIYNPEETLFLKLAKKHHLKTKNGLKMLIFQAIKAQMIWNDKEIKYENNDN